MANNFYVNMSLNLRRTKIYFLTIAVVSFVIIFISYNWNIPENIYKISSEISKVRISEFQLKNIRIREQMLETSSTRAITSELAAGIIINESTQRKTVNNTKIKYAESISERQTINGVQTSGNEAERVEYIEINGPIESQENKPSSDRQATKASSQTGQATKTSSQTVEIMGKVENNHTADRQNINSTSSSEIKDINQNMISDGNIQNLTSNKSKNSFEKIQNSKNENKEVLREIHRLKDEISSDHKSTALQRNKPLKSRYQVVRKNSSNHLKTERDYQALHRIRNRLKQIGRSNSGFIMPFQNKVFNFDNNDDSDVTSRPDVCTGCFESNFKKLINEPTLCDGEVEILFMIASTFSRQDSRNAIRNTWCEQCNKPNSKIKMVFVFGNRNDTIDNINLQSESTQYHDIIQLDFHDTYANLTYKTITSLKWSEEYCKKAKFVMKTDDDMYVNTELLPLMLKAAPSEKLIGGMCWGPSSPHRDLNSKWYVSFVQYRHSLFPSMCSGTGYVMSRDVVSGVLKESPNVPFFYLEDVYVAICVKRIGVTPLLLEGFKNQRVEFEPCTYRNRIITAHELSADYLHEIWDQSRTCRKEDLSPEMVYRPIPV